MLTSIRPQDDPPEVAAVRQALEQIAPIERLDLLAELTCREALAIAQEGDSSDALNEAADFVILSIETAFTVLGRELVQLAESSSPSAEVN